MCKFGLLSRQMSDRPCLTVPRTGRMTMSDSCFVLSRLPPPCSSLHSSLLRFLISSLWALPAHQEAFPVRDVLSFPFTSLSSPRSIICVLTPVIPPLCVPVQFVCGPCIVVTPKADAVALPKDVGSVPLLQGLPLLGVNLVAAGRREKPSTEPLPSALAERALCPVGPLGPFPQAAAIFLIGT